MTRLIPSGTDHWRPAFLTVVNIKEIIDAEKKEVYVSGNGGGTGLGMIAGIILAALVLFALLFFLGVFDGKQGADVTIEAPKIDAPKIDTPKAD